MKIIGIPSIRVCVCVCVRACVCVCVCLLEMFKLLRYFHKVYYGTRVN